MIVLDFLTLAYFDWFSCLDGDFVHRLYICKISVHSVLLFGSVLDI